MRGRGADRKGAAVRSVAGRMVTGPRRAGRMAGATGGMMTAVIAIVIGGIRVRGADRRITGRAGRGASGTICRVAVRVLVLVRRGDLAGRADRDLVRAGLVGPAVQR